MKRLVLLVALVAVAASAALVVMAAEDQTAGSKAKAVNLTGTIACTSCTLAHPDKPCGKSCCTGCIKGGDPALLVDDDGNLFLLVTSERGKPLMTRERLEMIGGKVAVKGQLVKGKGIQAIYVDSIEKP